MCILISANYFYFSHQPSWKIKAIKILHNFLSLKAIISSFYILYQNINKSDERYQIKEAVKN